MQTQAAQIDQRRRLNQINDTKNLIALQKQYEAANALMRLDKAGKIAPASDQVRIKLDQASAIADMERLHEELRLLGDHPIVQRVNMDTTKATRAWNIFTHGTLDGQDTRKTLENLGKRFRDVLSTNVNIGPFNASIAGVITTLTALAPVLVAVGGAAGSLVATLGSGMVAAAGLGGAALSGLGLAAIGLKSALQQPLQQLSQFKTALNAYQNARLQYGPASTGPAGQRAAASVPLDQQRVRVDQQRIAVDERALAAAIKQHGDNSIQAAHASVTLAGAQNQLAGAQHTLANAQNTATTSSNRTQKALDKLNSVVAQSSPAMQAAEKGWIRLSTIWGKLTGPTARVDLGLGLSSSLKTANADVGFFARDTNKAMNNLLSGWEKWMAALRSPAARHILDNLYQNFNRSVKPLMDGLGNIAAALGKWFSTMSDYLPGFAKSFDNWARGVNNAADATHGWASGAATLVHSFESLGRLSASVGRWLFALFAPGVRPGNNFVDQMAASIDRTAKGMRTLQGQSNLTDFYNRSISGTKELWRALTPLASVFVHLAALFAPLAQAAVPILTFFTKLGAAVTGAAGPFGHLLLDITAFLAVGRLIGKLEPLLGLFGNLRRASDGVSKGIGRIGASIGGLRTGGVGGMVEAWRGAATKTSTSVATTIEERLNAGAARLDETMVTGAARLADGVIEGAKVAQGILAGGEISGARTGGAIIAAEERAGLTSAGTLGQARSIAATPGAGGNKPFAGRVIGALGVGATLWGASSLAGGLVGGQTGQHISNVGTYMAAGATVGTLFGPGGTIGGAILGGLAGTFAEFVHGAPSFGEQFAKGFTRGFGGTDFRKQQQHMADQFKSSGDPWAGQDNLKGVNTPLTPADQRRREAIALTWGESIAKQLVKGWSQYKNQSEPIMLTQLYAEIKNPRLPMAARAAAVSAAVEYARGLEKSGRLPKGEAQHMLTQIESIFPQLINYMGRSAKQASAAFHNAFDLTSSRTRLKATLDKMRGDFPEIVEAMDTTKGSIEAKSKAVVAALQNIAKNGTAKAKRDARHDLEELVGVADLNFGKIASNAASMTGKMKDAVSTNTNQAFMIGSKNFAGLASNIGTVLASGAAATKKGLENITAQVNGQLKAIGGGRVSTVTIAAYKNDPGVIAGLLTGQISAGGASSPHYSGGRVPGGQGNIDNWTLVDPSGRPKGKVAGDEILIANRHTESRVDSMLQYFGTSLDAEVNAEHTPHSWGPSSPRATPQRGAMAAGGAVNFYGKPQGVSPGIRNLIGDMEQHFPSLMVTATTNGGHANGSYHYLGEAVDMAADPGTMLSAARWVMSSGIYRSLVEGIHNPNLSVHSGAPVQPGFWGASTWAEHVNHIHLAMTGMLGQSAGGGAGGGVAASLWDNLKSPIVRGGGGVGRVVQRTLSDVVNAANKYGNAHAGISMGGGAGTDWTPVIRGALRAAGIHNNIPEWVSMIQRQIQHESGGNPRAINTTDINAQRGDPSRGLMQVIGSTFSHYAMSPFNKNIYDPLSNILAAIRYIEGAYGGESGGLSYMIANAGRAYATGGRPRSRSHAPSHKTPQNAHTPVPKSILNDRKEQEYQAKIQRALNAYYNYNHYIHKTASPKHPVGTLGHFTGKAGHWAGSGKRRHWDPSTLKWHPSTQHIVGGINKQELAKLETMLNRVQTLIREDPHYDTGNRHKFSSVYDLPARDRIGGIGTDDIEQALSAATTEWQDYDQNIHNRTDSNGRPIRPSSKELAKDKSLHSAVTKLQGLDNSAKSYIQDFSNIESEIGILGSYMDQAAGSPNDKAWGNDPGMGKTPRQGSRVQKTWAQWKKIREYWEQRHTTLLHNAYSDARRRMGKTPDRWGIAYLQTLGTSMGTSDADLAALKATQDPGGSLTDVNAYVQSLGLQGPLDKLNYQTSIDQGRVVPDNPGTPVREDLQSMIPETRDAQYLYGFYDSLLNRAQRDPRVKNNYALLTSISDARNSARDNWMQLNQQQLDAQTATGPGQLQLFDTARENMFATYASNVASLAPSTGAVGAAMASASGATGAGILNPAQMASAPAPVGGGGTTVNVTNHYQTQPSDPHLWSQGVAFELQAAL
jgi:hypothetical protein